MKIIIAGNMGYVGPGVVSQLRNKYPGAEIIGYDMGYFGNCLSNPPFLSEVKLDRQIIGDVRDFEANILDNADTVIYLAAITGINHDYYEAAEIDGANVFQQVRHVTLPLLKPTFITLLLLSLGRILRGQFELFFNIVGNNGVLFPATDIIDTFVYRSVTRSFDIGLGAAAGLYQSIFGFGLIIAVNAIIRKVNEDYALF
jgi:hypothetical protein